MNEVVRRAVDDLGAVLARARMGGAPAAHEVSCWLQEVSLARHALDLALLLSHQLGCKVAADGRHCQLARHHESVPHEFEPRDPLAR